ncbi:hypothetical protein [Sulfuritalea sp.]|uniref:hypothetical protein n=1 Tax=Sulfuritalea sp. TaxID=2480090 RepID=UPI001AD5401D|nr:hypothetical protein [Sulfuritalea sp.]MBN8476052.1 hypothetical protein [Sulfuritalea sp.]
MNWFEQVKVLLFPPVTRRMALDIARQALAQSVASEPLICHPRKPADFNIYAGFREPCWWVQVPWNDDSGQPVLRSSRVIVIGRQSGKILYDGSAGDEG